MLTLSDLQRKWLNSFGKNYIPMVAMITSQVLHVFWSYLFVIHYDMEIVGTGIASSITTGTALFIMLGYTYFQEDIKEAVQWPDRSTFVDLAKYLEIGIPCALINSSGYMAFHLLTFLSGYFGVVAQNVQLIMLNFSGIYWMVGVGLWQASATIIGQKIGNLEVESA